MRVLKYLYGLLTNVVFANFVFWSWNLLFLVLLFYFELQLGVLDELAIDAFIGKVPFDFVIFTFIMMAIPFVSIFLVAFKWVSNPEKIMHLFYGVEMPLIGLCLLRLAILRELIPGTFHFLFLFAGGMIVYFLNLLGVFQRNDKKWSYINMIGQTFLLIIGIYAACVILFFAIPMGWTIVNEFFKFQWFEIFELGFWLILLIIFMAASATVFVGLPIAVPTLYLTSFFNRFRDFAARFGRVQGNTLVGLTIGLNILLFYVLNWGQPQVDIFERLAMADKAPALKKDLLEDKDEIEAGLLNAYLSPYRYVSSVSASNNVKEIYHDVFSMEQNNAQPIQDAFNTLMKPFLYEGNMTMDPDKAEKLYREFFDAPLQRRSSAAVIHAMQARWDRDGIEAGLLNINGEKVMITDQIITVKESGDHAEVELYECYRNMTFERQEIFYYFHLPESAVITGLWLSDENNFPKKYAYTVAPRGAAQEVYKEQVRRRVDPSLLEQVGPSQYRLRAFPIQPRTKNYKRVGDDPLFTAGENFHLWLTYRVFRENDAFPLPVLSEKRNVYWSDETSLKINGVEVERKDDEWLPGNVPAANKSAITEHWTRIGEEVPVRISPYELDSNAIPRNRKYAIIIDRSFSMNEHRKELIKSLGKIKSSGYVNTEASDIYLGGNHLEKADWKTLEKEFEENADVNHLIFYGTGNTMYLLEQFTEAAGSNRYDGVILFTDQGSYELAADRQTPLELNSPLYLVHLGGKYPGAYDDALLETVIKSKGYMTTGVEDVFFRSGFRELRENSPELIALEDGYLFSIAEHDHRSEKNVEVLAGRQFIRHTMQENDTIERLQRLDAVHRIAQQLPQVSPFSSMIVLVNDVQREALEKASAREDRFDREVETGQETLTKPNNIFSVSGTPEPEEWVLIILGGLFALYGLFKSKLL